MIFTCLTYLPAGDFNGDGLEDPAIFRPSTGLWAVRSVTRLYFGVAGDFPVPGDFNGDGIFSPAVFRPSSGLWAIRGSTAFYFGGAADSPVTGDFNGNGTDEVGIYRPVDGLWAIRDFTRFYFGGSGDYPIPGDYSGEGRVLPAIFRGEKGLWAIRSLSRFYFGNSSDLPVPADYNGDGRLDYGIFRSSIGLWAVRGITRRYFGGPNDYPQPFSMGGAGSDRISVFRSATGSWAVEGISRFYYGGVEDFSVTSPSHWLLPELPELGIEVMIYHRDTEHLDKLVEAGAGSTRMNHLSWADIEPVNTTADNYLWEEHDQILADYAERGFSPIVTISSIPSWAGKTRTGPFNGEARDDFAQFVGAVVRRYSRPPYKIKYWEFFNEPDGTMPNLGPGGATSWGDSGTEYALMLKAIYPAVKAADPAARVVMGGLAYDSFVEDTDSKTRKAFIAAGKGGIFKRDFIDKVLENGGGDYFDIMNFHYYYFARDTWGNIIGKTDYLKALLARYGYNKPMICTEVGIWGYEEEYYLDLQARYLPMVYARGLSAGLEAVLWYPLASDKAWAFQGGLLREEDLSAKPAYLSYQTMISEISGYVYSDAVETGAANLEGYEFISRLTGKSKQMIWADEDTSGYLSFPHERIRSVTIDGSEHHITDSGSGDSDGRDNGQVMIPITSSPLYVESW